jgi:hypothetical protein
VFVVIHYYFVLSSQGQISRIEILRAPIVPLIQNQIAGQVETDAVVRPSAEAVDAGLEI